MNHANRRYACALLLGALLTPHSRAAGPTSVLYVMNYGEFSGGTVTGLDLFQGLSQSSFPTGHLVDICIGVAGGDVRTMGYSGADSGSRFDLAGSPLSGGPYTNTIALSQLHDGTSDGSFNYSVNYSTGDVLQFDRSWGSPTVLFNANDTLGGAGWITMNATDGSFWLSEWGGPDRVEHRTHAGALISSFNWGIFGTAGLALDPVDGTLWTSDGSSKLFQFSQAGVPLQSITTGAAGSFYGMEFETTTTPAPGPLAAFGMLTATLMHRRHRR